MASTLPGAQQLQQLEQILPGQPRSLIPNIPIPNIFGR
jgi:hypothetical protein